ncbi:PAS domain S-box protein [Synechococcus sp. CS-1328]|uniref:PAS domain S-box protein n=1 Tax=Synechococcus sp. CS-1328 TaxID=2847976 RepID=UPI00223A7088|nr:PAS domain S-box protein [Synechococcus sp. CS-1328]MCT0224610.1 PAS domain S-box protein [Synechococcus sp. CS-1328]
MAKGVERDDSNAMMAAIDRSNAVATFSMDGEILSANENFLNFLGYKLNEILGKHHRIFLDATYAKTKDYKDFWNRLSQGDFVRGEFKRLGKGGKEVWLQATYTPVKDSNGEVVKVVKIASDVSEAKLISSNNAGMIAGIEKAMAVVEFKPDGTILAANQVFADLTGYSLAEIKGLHHRIMVDPDYAQSEEYTEFWRSVSSGVIQHGRFRRITKDGDDIWLQSTYTPIFNPDGELIKIVKFAYDVTTSVRQSKELELALEESHRAKELEIALAKVNEAEKARREMDLAIQEISTPVTPIWEGILLLPLVGILDSTRASSIMTKSLEMISQKRAKIFVLDISGVATVDTAVANQLIKITKATQLMGCDAIISGLSPAIARTIVELGVNVGEIRTTATLRDAFETALTSLGHRIGQSIQDDSVKSLALR